MRGKGRRGEEGEKGSEGKRKKRGDGRGGIREETSDYAHLRFL